MRCFLAITVLMNYLAVMLAGNFMPKTQLISEHHPYVHAADCQQNNYLMLDCWDKCNGDFLNASTPDVPQDEAILLLTSLDLHVSPEGLSLGAGQTFPFLSSFTVSPLADFPKGYLQEVAPPPKSGTNILMS